MDNDKTLDYLCRIALSQVEAGADMVAPSDMMDGRVGAIRSALDRAGRSNTPIMSYAAKYASAFYGPFRDAAGSAPAFGDRKSYQMDWHNSREAVKEALADVEEGADIVMVKPAMAYGDIIARVKAATNVPVAAYSVSGEYAMVKTCGRLGLGDETALMCEIAAGAFRAGADIYLTYFARELAEAMAGALWGGAPGRGGPAPFCPAGPRRRGRGPFLLNSRNTNENSVLPNDSRCGKGSKLV